MKAKEYLKSKGLKNPPLDSGISGGGDAPRQYASDVMDAYARIQIEKDRERVKQAIAANAVEIRLIDDLPIRLD